MYRRATFAIVVSRISMNVGTTTTQATTQWLIAGRLTAAGLSVMLLMMRPPVTVEPMPSRAGLRGRGRWSSGQGLASDGPVGRAADGCRTCPAFGPVGGSL